MADTTETRPGADILSVVSEHVTLEQMGARYQGNCPFHNGPGFRVMPDQGIYHCFACGATGDAIKFVMERQGMTFPEAVQHLAKRAGITEEG